MVFDYQSLEVPFWPFRRDFAARVAYNDSLSEKAAWLQLMLNRISIQRVLPQHWVTKNLASEAWKSLTTAFRESPYHVAVVMLMLVLVLFLVWNRSTPPATSRGQRALSWEAGVSPHRRRTLSGTEVWRSTRDRASTFDFFGMHQSSFPIAQHVRLSNRTGGAKIARARNRTGSMDFLFRSETNPGDNGKFVPKGGPDGQVLYQDEGYLFDEFGLITLSYQVIYNGTSRSTVDYWAWTPPAPWKEASRSIVPQDIMLKLQRKLSMDVSKATITIQEPESRGKWDFSLPINEFSTHVIPPVEGGVLNLYVKGTPKEEWMEYTFESAHLAAQFQLDLLSYQVFGNSLHHMYQVLSLVNQGCIANEGQEFVLHDDEVKESEPESDDKISKPTSTVSGVAWDDAMRALSSIPSIRIALERLWLHHRNHGYAPSTAISSKNLKKANASNVRDSNGSESTQMSLKDEYVNKRLLLGPVDFFRLFVPILPETAVLESKSHKSRMEQLLRWRKRAARAAVLIRAYTTSRRIVNHGWHLDLSSLPNSAPFTKRLAYDDNDDNNRRDFTAKNEYYEATVSRDVLCHVRPEDYFSGSASSTHDGDSSCQRTSVLSPYQAFSLVGAHIFKVPTDHEMEHPLHPSRDPVAAIPSLRDLISENPDVDFMVYAFYPKVLGVAVIICHVRSLAKGIDPKFDNVMNRYINGSSEIRDRKLHLMIQLGPYLGLSFAAWAVLRFLSFLLNVTQKGREAPAGLETSRPSFPAIRLMDFTRTQHFGGALQTDPAMPKNYVSVTSSYQSQHLPNLLARCLLYVLESSSFTTNVFDFTFLLEGQQEDEVPERAVSTIRMVHVDSEDVALPTDCTRALKWDLGENTATVDMSQHRLFSNIVSQTLQEMVAIVETLRTPQRQIPESTEASKEVEPEGLCPELNLIDSEDLLEIATNEVTELLSEAVVPVRKNKNPERRTDMTSISALDLVSRDDMKRYILASNFDIKFAAIRIVETMAWRSVTFPIDTRKCRIELQNGQFFQQGKDLQGNPVFYFRNVCLGPWRKDVDAIVASVLHRFDQGLKRAMKSDPAVKCTIIIMMGWPCCEEYLSTTVSSASSTKTQASSQDQADDGQNSTRSTASGDNVFPQHDLIANPRIPSDETWFRHSNKTIVYRLVEILTAHYPERLSKGLVIPGIGKNHFFGTTVSGRFALSSLADSGATRGKVIFLKKASDLRDYVAESELLKIVGGKAPVHPDAYSYN